MERDSIKSTYIVKETRYGSKIKPDKPKKSIMDILLSIFWFISVLCIIAIVTLLVVSQMSPSSLCENICKSYNGTFWTMSDCDSSDMMACAGYCVLSNQTTLYCEDILNNITSADG